jgi:hypothetical protein
MASNGDDDMSSPLINDNASDESQDAGGLQELISRASNTFSYYMGYTEKATDEPVR